MIARSLAVAVALVGLSGCVTVPDRDDQEEAVNEDRGESPRHHHLVFCDGGEAPGSHLVDCITPLPGPVL